MAPLPVPPGCTFTSKKIREWDEIDCTELLLRLDPGHEQYLPRILVYLHFHLDGISLAHLSEKDLKNIGYHLESPMSKSLARQINNVRDKLKSQSNIETEYEITFEKPHHLGLELGIKDASALIVEKVLDSVAIDIQNVQPGEYITRVNRTVATPGGQHDLLWRTLLEAPLGRRLTLRFARSAGGGQPPLPRRRPGAAAAAAAAAATARGGAPPVPGAPSSGAGATATQMEYHTARGAASAGGGRGPSPGLPLPTGVLPGGVVGAAGGGTAPPGGGAREGGGKAGGDVTYSDNMIAHALNQLPDRKGTFKEILGLIEKQFAMQLNWKLGSSALRNTPVWKSSVRKILFSNKKFSLADRCYRRGNVFTFTHLTTKK